jgi:uncharacterized membrane protein YfcA
VLDPWVIAAIAVIVLLGAGLQGAVGFGMGLVAVPLLLFSGRTLPEAVAVLLGAGLLQTAYGAWLCRREIPWKQTASLAAVQWVAVPVGVMGMGLLAAAGPAVVKQVVGAIVIGLLILRAVLRPKPRDSVGTGWGVVASVASGLLAGLVGMGGPPIVLYALAHDWEKDTFRGFLFATFLLVLPTAGVALAWRMGVQVLGWTVVGAAMFPAVVVGSKVGFGVSKRWDAATMRRVATGLLVVIAGWSLIGPFVTSG